MDAYELHPDFSQVMNYFRNDFMMILFQNLIPLTQSIQTIFIKRNEADTMFLMATFDFERNFGSTAQALKPEV